MPRAASPFPTCRKRTGRIESFGGSDSGAVNWDAKTTLSHLGDSGDNMLFLNIPGNAAYDAKVGDYLEAIVETNDA